MKNEKQRALNLISTLIELKKDDHPTVYRLYKNPKSKKKILEIILKHFEDGGADTYEKAIIATDRTFDINSYED